MAKIAKAETTKVETTTPGKDDLVLLETRKVKALEKIGNSLDALVIWFEEIDKNEWSERVQYYLAEFHKTFVEERNDK